MKIEVIGSGCKKCKSLFELTQEIVTESKIESEVLYSTDVSKITDLGLMSSPVLTINNRPILAGALPDKDKLKKIIVDNIAVEKNPNSPCCSRNYGNTC